MSVLNGKKPFIVNIDPPETDFTNWLLSWTGVDVCDGILIALNCSGFSLNCILLTLCEEIKSFSTKYFSFNQWCFEPYHKKVWNNKYFLK